jgi:SOS-response transcriptional repressor LexA/lambda repressor-like predicted transcriptional regulator
MDVIGRLIAAVDASRYKRVRIAADAGMSPTKLSKILNRKQVPSVTDFIAIAQAIHLDPARIFTDRELVVEVESVRAAHAASQQLLAASERVAAILENLLPEPQSARAVIPLPRPPREQRVAPVLAAANPNAELMVELETERKLIPRRAWNRGARIIARVVGDSMDGGPDPILDGELAYLKKTRSPRTARNKIVLLRRDDGLYLKTFEMSGHTVRLVSANPASPPIELDARVENLQIYGYVVDHAPSD